MSLRLNHAVLFVRNLEASVAFYRDVLGFTAIEGMGGVASVCFLRAPGSTNDHDLGLFEMAADAGPSGAGSSTVGLTHLAWEVDTLANLEALAQKLTSADALVGSTDHGTTKSLYAKDPNGIDLEVCWLVPADQLTEADSPKPDGTLNLRREFERFGAETRGGVGISVLA